NYPITRLLDYSIYPIRSSMTRFFLRGSYMRSFASVIAVSTLMCSVVHTQAPAPNQPPRPKPAFAGQTNAPPAKPSPPFTVETVAARLDAPWSFAFLPDGNFLITESRGAMRIARPDGVVSAPIAGLPDIKAVAAQGLHDVVLDPEFARNRL